MERNSGICFAIYMLLKISHLCSV